MNFFDGLVRSLRSKNDRDDQGLRSWARIEYKQDADYAYHYFKTTGHIPTLGVKI